MARKRKAEHRAKRFTVQCGKLDHETSPRRFAVWLRAGLIVLIHNRLARVSDTATSKWEAGELHLEPAAQPEPSIKTNAEVVDRSYIKAHNGQVKVSREERMHFASLRWQLGDLAEELIGDYLNNKRQFDMRAQYGW